MVIDRCIKESIDILKKKDSTVEEKVYGLYRLVMLIAGNLFAIEGIVRTVRWVKKLLGF